MSRRSVWTLTLVAGMIVWSWACKHAPAVVAPTPPTPPASRTLFALLPDPNDGSVGQATVSNAQGSVDLRAAGESTLVVGGQAPPAPAALEGTEVQRIFGDALSVLPPPPQQFVLNFDFDSEQLTEASRRLVPGILELVRQRPVPDVSVVGHTDTTGNPAGNYELGMRRATIVRDLLVAAGLEPSLIEVTSHGEADLLVKTPDETREPRNRRVEIAVK